MDEELFITTVLVASSVPVSLIFLLAWMGWLVERTWQAVVVKFVICQQVIWQKSFIRCHLFW